MFEEALSIALRAHRGQEYKRKNTNWPYIIHPIKVAMHFIGNDFLMTVAVLHDVAEDTHITLKDIEAKFGIGTCNAVDALTRRSNEDYNTYIKRVKKNNAAIMIKLADLEENINALVSSDAPSEKITLIMRYINARNTLLDTTKKV